MLVSVLEPLGENQTLAYIPIHGHEDGRKIARRTEKKRDGHELRLQVTRIIIGTPVKGLTDCGPELRFEDDCDHTEDEYLRNYGDA